MYKKTLLKLKNNFRLPGKFMKTYLFLLVTTLFCMSASAQKPIEIGKVANETFTITADTAILRKALEQTLNDGTHINSMHIESENRWHYLVGNGILRNYSKTIAVELTYNINTRSFWLVPEMGHKTCAAAGCVTCAPFKENGKIIGCNCKEQGTVSNECNFKTVTPSPFYIKVNRYLK